MTVLPIAERELRVARIGLRCDLRAEPVRPDWRQEIPIGLHNLAVTLRALRR